MPGHGEKLNRKHEQAIVALLTCGSILEAATQCRVDESTLRRWLKEERFQRAYREARRQVVQHAMVHLQQATGQAVQTLQEVMQAPDAPASARVSAAKTVLEVAVKGLEVEDLDARVAALEAVLVART